MEEISKQQKKINVKAAPKQQKNLLTEDTGKILAFQLNRIAIAMEAMNKINEEKLKDFKKSKALERRKLLEEISNIEKEGRLINEKRKNERDK